MSAEKQYNRNREIVFEEKGINPADKNYNCHHIIFRSDVKKGLVPKDYPINAVENLMPLPIGRHDALHKYIETNGLQNDISSRVNLAHLAEVGELDFYADIQPRQAKHHTKGHQKHGNKRRR